MPERDTQWSHAGVRLTDVVYAALPGYRPLHLDLYRATNAPAPQPLVIFIHGGAWAFANPRAGAAFIDFTTILANLAERGYVVASVEYRFSGEASFPAQIDDVATAVRFLRSNAARLGIDGTKVAMWGMSAGAYLAAMQGMNCMAGTCVQGWVGWFGVYDFTPDINADPELARLLGCAPSGCTMAVLESLSPIHFADAKDPPALLVHGSLDEPEESQRLVEKLHSVGAPVEFLLIPDVSHGFVGSTEAATKAALRQALAATFEFLDRNLKHGERPAPVAPPPRE